MPTIFYRTPSSSGILTNVSEFYPVIWDLILPRTFSDHSLVVLSHFPKITYMKEETVGFSDCMPVGNTAKLTPANHKILFPTAIANISEMDTKWSIFAIKGV